MSQRSNPKHEMIKIPKMVEKTFQDRCIGKDCLNRFPVSQEIKAKKIYNWDLINLKRL